MVPMLVPRNSCSACLGNSNFEHKIQDQTFPYLRRSSYQLWESIGHCGLKADKQKVHKIPGKMSKENVKEMSERQEKI